jgi:succinoglycan biosynthesis protein ExoM
LHIVICIGTFRRPHLLPNLFRALGALRFCKVGQPTLEMIIVDNDIARTAEEICETAALPWTVRYVCEPRRGIARMRNRAISECGDFDFLVFIDDDEVPDPEWLDELLSTQARFSADVVSGPVLPVFFSGAPEWIRNGGFFDRPVFETGDVIERCSTNNVLIRNSVFKSVPGFDERFNLTGGEDTHFFSRVRRAGHSMVWSREAVVHEYVPLERAKTAWIGRRGYQSGNSWVLCELALDHRARAWWMRLAKALAHIAKGAVGFFFSLPSGKAATVWSLRRVCLGVGMLAALLGHRFLPYRDSAADAVENAAEVGTQA